LPQLLAIIGIYNNCFFYHIGLALLNAGGCQSEHQNYDIESFIIG